MAYRVHLTLKSNNRKTGPVPVSTTEARSCPDDCPFRGEGCYAESGPLALHWAAVSDGRRGMSWPEFCGAVARFPAGQFWRHNQAGDLPHVDGTIDAHALDTLVRANVGRRGFTYSHHNVARNYANRRAIQDANAMGFTINLSANSPAHADTLLALGIAPVVTVLPAEVHGNVTLATPAGARIVVCPATYRDDTSCDTCRLCAVRDRPVVVGFPAHGTGAKRASLVVTGGAS